jgi:SAM-dependent methyltransferase
MARDDAKRIMGLNDRRAAQHEKDRARSRPPLFEKPWLDKFAGLLPARGSILDVGCGSGDPIARYFIGKSFRVSGIDSSPAMIATCARRFPEEDWIADDMRTLAIDRQFDGTLAWDSFFHLTPEDQRGMFSVFRRHAGARAALMFTSGPRFGEAIGEYQGEPLYHASLDPDEYRGLLSGNDFQVVAHADEDQSCNGHTIWLAQRV